MVTNVPGSQPGQCPRITAAVCWTASRLSRQAGPAAALPLRGQRNNFGL